MTSCDLIIFSSWWNLCKKCSKISFCPSPTSSVAVWVLLLFVRCFFLCLSGMTVIILHVLLVSNSYKSYKYACACLMTCVMWLMGYLFVNMTLQGFFRRCITQGMTHKCANEEKCEITPFTRNSCQYCRLKKCFEVGMSREGKKYFVFLCCYGLSCLLSELVTYGVGLVWPLVSLHMLY